MSINQEPTTDHTTQSNHEIPAHLQPMLGEIHSTLTESQKQQKTGLMIDYQDIFQVGSKQYYYTQN